MARVGRNDSPNHHADTIRTFGAEAPKHFQLEALVDKLLGLDYSFDEIKDLLAGRSIDEQIIAAKQALAVKQPELDESSNDCREETLAIIKPEALRGGYAGEICERILAEFTMKKAGITRPTHELAEEHYGQYRGEGFFNRTVASLASGEVMVFVLAGNNAIQRWRDMMGSRDMSAAQPGTIRGTYMRADRPEHETICHGSASQKDFQRELGLWQPYLA